MEPRTHREGDSNARIGACCFFSESRLSLGLWSFRASYAISFACIKYALDGNLARIRIDQLSYRSMSSLLIILEAHWTTVCPIWTTAKIRQIVERVEPCLEQAVEQLTGVQRRRSAATAACPQAGCATGTPVGDPHPLRRNIVQTLSTDYGFALVGLNGDCPVIVLFSPAMIRSVHYLLDWLAGRAYFSVSADFDRGGLRSSMKHVFSGGVHTLLEWQPSNPQVEPF